MRPGRGSRPRTKTRPVHAGAVDGFVTAVDRGRYTCLVAEHGPDARRVVAMRASELRKSAIVVGDRVGLVGDTSGRPDTLARIVRVAERSSVLRRSADDTDPAERVLVAGADQLLIVVAAADPEPRRGFIDRCLVAAYAGRLHPILLVTKTDLRDPAALLTDYRDLDITVLTSHRGTDPAIGRARDPIAAGVAPAAGVAGPDGGTRSEYDADPQSGEAPQDVASPDGGEASQGVAAPDGGSGTDPADAPLDDTALAAVEDALTGHITALVGHSGVGKSTLVNALVPDADRATGTVTGVGKGRHTSTSAIALPLPAGGWVVDTPGVRSFGLAHVSDDDILAAFDDLLPASADCPPGCTHRSDGIGCALDDLVTSGGATPGRLASFRRLLASRSGLGDPADA